MENLWSPWTTGMHLIDTLNYVEEEYNLYVNKDLFMLYVNICKGDWQKPKPEIIAHGTIDTAKTSSVFGVDPCQVVKDLMAKINKKLQDYFGGAIPQSWQDKIEQALQNLVLEDSLGMPQIKEGD